VTQAELTAMGYTLRWEEKPAIGQRGPFMALEAEPMKGKSVRVGIVVENAATAKQTLLDSIADLVAKHQAWLARQPLA
jgi:hypothetical protein